MKTTAIFAATLAVAACGTRPDDPFVPPETPPSPTWALNVVTVAQSPVARIAGNNAISGTRDDLGTMHLYWEDGTVLRHGFVSLDQTQWQLRTVPTFVPGATVRRPSVAYPSAGLVILAWLEQAGATNRIVVSRSLDYGATWDSPIALIATTASISSPVVHGFRRANGTAGAVVAWSEPPTPAPGRILSSTWRGAAWSIGEWTAIAPISANNTGSARDVSISGNGENLVAVWADTRGALAGGTGVFISRSQNGGQTWLNDGLLPVPIGTSAVGSEPSVTVTATGRVFVAWTASDGVYAAASSDGGLIFTAPRRLGPGFAPKPAANADGRVAIAWTGTPSAAADESQHYVSLSLSYDNLQTIASGPTAMPGSATTPARTQARAFVAGTTLDMVWLDVTGGQRAVQHRTARLP